MVHRRDIRIARTSAASSMFRNPDGEEEENCFRTIHAEINAIAQAAKHGVEIDGADIYVTASPCYHCLKTIMNTGIRRVVYLKPYKIHRIEPLLEHSQIELVQVSEEDLISEK